MLSYEASVSLLFDYGIPLPPQRLVGTAGEAVEAAAEIGGPVALKLLAAGHSHKIDAGLVRLDLRTAEEVRAAAGNLLAAPVGGPIEGLLVQAMVSGGREALLGALVDPQFGPLVALGPGGTAVEAVDRVDFLRVPFDRIDAALFIGRNALAPILAAGRGKGRADVEALTNALLRMAELIRSHAGEIRSVDINPLAILSDGVAALDCRIEEVPPCP